MKERFLIRIEATSKTPVHNATTLRLSVTLGIAMQTRVPTPD
jgi:hypothetical protein